MAGLLGRVVSLSHHVDEQLLDCLERGVAILETADNCCKDLFEGLGARFTFSDVLAAVLQDSLTGDNVLHIHISTPGRQLDRVEAVDQPIISCCKKSQLILCYNGCVWLQRFWVTKSALLLAMLGAEAVGGRAASMSLAGGYKVR